MNTKVIFADNSHFDEIHRIWGLNRGTLGLMPKDAFLECISKKWILVGINEENNTVNSYLQFRYTKRTQTVSIVHLCVDKDARGAKISRKLLDKLVDEYKHKSLGIKLNCRNDYKNAIAFWTDYNFQPKGESPSRGNDPNIKLITWWFNFGKNDLFSLSYSDKIKAVIDVNIIAKLMDGSGGDEASDEVRQLQTDWLVGEVEFFRASETLSEISRDTNDDRRGRSKKFIEQFLELNIDKPSINELESELRNVIAGNSDNDRSDRRQLSETILSGFRYFITMDDGILRQNAFFLNNYQIKVIRPSSFILEIDAILNAIDYFPEKLAASSFTINKATSIEKDELTNMFLRNKIGEPKFKLSTILNSLVLDGSSIDVIKENGNVVGVIGIKEEAERVIVPILRFNQDSLHQTLFMQALQDLVSLASKKNKTCVQLTEHTLNAIEKEVLAKRKFFFNDENGYEKYVVNKIISIEQATKELEKYKNRVPGLEEILAALSNENISGSSFHVTYFLEKAFWPLKIENSKIPCFIIPIKPFFAKQLFDDHAAKQDLFGVNPKLIWNNENVYYRNVQPNVERWPARILWYASEEKNNFRQKSIVCSSYMDDVVKGSAKDLFKKFQNFGIYSLEQHVKPLAKGDSQKEIKVVRFSDSEPFRNPIELRKVKAILKKNGEKDNNFQSPLRISESTFVELYSQGK